MKARGIFLLFLLSSMVLILFYLYVFSKSLHLERLEKERIANIQKVCMKEYPRNRDRGVLQRNVLEADRKIQTLLVTRPISFEPSSVSIDTNNTKLINKNRVTLKNIIDILNNINEDVILSISAHTDKDGSSIKNLKLSQERADVLKEYIFERTQIALITSIGYGEELPLIDIDNKKHSTNRRVEIILKRIKK